MTQQGVLQRYQSLVPKLLDRLDQIRDLSETELTYHQAFVRLVAELFETTSEQAFSFTDGPRDGGIDFYVAAPRTYAIYQCKSPSWENQQDTTSPRKFDAEPLREIDSALNFLKDAHGNYPYKPEVLHLRSMYHNDLSIHDETQPTTLSATVALAGELTEDATRTFNEMQRNYESEGIKLSLVTWPEIAQELERAEEPIRADISLNLRVDDYGQDVMPRRDGLYLVAKGYDLVQAFDEHGWQLFDLNVRLELPNSPINMKIQDTLRQANKRKRFHLYNNGILITCQQYTQRPGGVANTILLRSPQIINGCQTVRAMHRAFYRLPPAEQEKFKDDVRLHVKVVKTSDPDFISELVQSTNEQNPMSPRNLKSNSLEQCQIRDDFRGLTPKWFFERKDGEYWSLRSGVHGRVRGFRRPDFEVTRSLVRKISNVVVAQAWNSLTGHASESRAGAVGGGAGYFTHSDTYNRLFTKSPNNEFWQRFREPSFDESDRDDLRDERVPSPYQFLLAATIDAFVKRCRVRPIDSRREAIERGVRTGSLRASASQPEIDGYLSQDRELHIDRFIYELKDILVELIAFVLVRRYADLTPNTCRLILNQPHEKEFVNNAFDANRLLPPVQDETSIIAPTYEFILHCTRQFYPLNRGEIESAPSIKAYVSDHQNVVRMKETVVEENDAIAIATRPWKPDPIPFGDTLPQLTT